MPLKRIVLDRDISFDMKAFRENFLSDSKSLEQLLTEEIKEHQNSGECTDVLDSETLVTSRMIPMLSDKLAADKAYPTLRAFWATDKFAIAVKLTGSANTEAPVSPFVGKMAKANIQYNYDRGYADAKGKPKGYSEPENRRSKYVTAYYSFCVLARPIASSLLEDLKMESLVSADAFKDVDALSPDLAGVFDIELVQPEVTDFRLDVYGFSITNQLVDRLNAICSSSAQAEKLLLTILFKELVTQVNILKHYVESYTQLRTIVRSGVTNVIE